MSCSQRICKFIVIISTRYSSKRAENEHTQCSTSSHNSPPFSQGGSTKLLGGVDLNTGEKRILIRRIHLGHATRSSLEKEDVYMRTRAPISAALATEREDLQIPLKTPTLFLFLPHDKIRKRD